jgi:anaerobic selenocysteine-containing dehydrogenase
MEASKTIKLDTLADVNDIGKPWRYEEDGLTVTRSSVWSPPGCHPVGCGLKLYVDKDGKLVKVEGDENHPVTQGRLCPRCITMKDYVYNPSRIIHPMKRDPKDRGKADKWVQITREEAFDLIEKEYNRITGKYGRESCVIFAGTGREGGTMMPYGSSVFRTPNYCYTQSGYACYIPRLASASYLIGVTYPEADYAGGLPGRYEDPAYEVPECLILWGKAPLESNPDGFFGHSIIDLMRRGTRIITIDPRVNWLSTRADYHLRLRAGTDTALAMAMLNIIIKEELYDKDFVESWTYGFEQLAERVLDMPPEKAAEICGLKTEDIYAAARMYATAKPASILWGLAVDQKANGMQNGQCIIALMAITGNMDVPGGQILPDVNSGLNEVGFNVEKGIGENLPKMIGLQQYPAYCNLIMNSHADLTLQAMETGEPYPLKFGFYAGNNMITCTSAEPQRWAKAIAESLEFCMTIDCFLTPSTEATCDLIFPLATVCERDGAVFTHYSAAPVTTGFGNKAIEPLGDSLSDLEMVYYLGKRLHPEMWEGYDSVNDLIDKLRFGGQFKFEDVHTMVSSQREVKYRKYETGDLRRDGKPGFNTPTGQIELYATIFEQFGDNPLPYYEEPQYSPVNTPELLEEYPFVLTSGARVFAFFHSEQRQIPYLRELNPDPLVEIHPKNAAKLGIADGQWCEVYNQFGSAKLKAKVTYVVDEKTIHAQHGWWFPEEDGNAPNLYGTFRSNINNLVPHFHFGKLGFGAPFKCLLCNIKPIAENYDTDMNLIWDKYGKAVCD